MEATVQSCDFSQLFQCGAKSNSNVYFFNWINGDHISRNTLLCAVLICLLHLPKFQNSQPEGHTSQKSEGVKKDSELLERERTLG